MLQKTSRRPTSAPHSFQTSTEDDDADPNKKRKILLSEEEYDLDDLGSSKKQNIKHDEALASKEAEFEPLALRQTSYTIQSDDFDPQDSPMKQNDDEASSASTSPAPSAVLSRSPWRLRILLPTPRLRASRRTN